MENGEYASSLDQLDITLPGAKTGTLPWGSAAIELPNGNYLRFIEEDSTWGPHVAITNVTNVCNNIEITLHHNNKYPGGVVLCYAHIQAACPTSSVSRKSAKICESLGGKPTEEDPQQMYRI